MQAATIVIADDHPMIRAGVKATFQDKLDYQVIGEAANGAQVLTQVRTHRPDMLILDLEMDGEPPDRLIPECRKLCPQLRILILSSHTDAKYLTPLRALGIDGFVLKSEGPDSLLPAVRVVWAGATWFSHDVLAQELAISREERSNPRSRLTHREQQILDLMTVGKDNATIAEELSLSKQTVRRYATIIYEKLGVKNRIQAIVGN